MPDTRRRFLARGLAATVSPALARSRPRVSKPTGLLAVVATDGPPQSAPYPPLPDGARPFAPGEKLRFGVEFERFSAGEATLEVVGPATVDTQSGLLVRYTAESHGLVSLFYRLRDRTESLLDPLFLFTRRLETWTEQGSRRRHRVILFEPDERRLLQSDVGGETETRPLEGHVVDGLGLIYHIRARGLEPGGRLAVPLYRKGSVTSVTLGASDVVVTETPAGRFETTEVRPVEASGQAPDQEGGLFGASLSVWLTTDRRRLPVRLAGSTKRGSIDARLSRLSLPPA